MSSKQRFASRTVYSVSAGCRDRKAQAVAAEVVAMKAAGERPVDIARKVGITKNSVYRILRAKGMNQSAVRMAGEQTRADEIAAMKANGKRATDIARELGIDTSSVYRILRERQASESVAAEGAPSETE